MIRISICLVVLELWPKICQNESFRHFPRPEKKVLRVWRICIRSLVFVALKLSYVYFRYHASGKHVCQWFLSSQDWVLKVPTRSDCFRFFSNFLRFWYQKKALIFLITPD